MTRVHWSQDHEIVSRLPILYKGYALYSRCMLDRATGTVKGGSLLFRVLRLITKRLSLREVAEVRIGNQAMWLNLCDARALTVFDEARGENWEGRVLRACINEGDSFLDVGANHGSYAMIAARLVGRRGKVVAFEPQPCLAALIRKSFEANQFSEGVVYEIACSDRSGVAEFYVPAAGSGSAGLYETFSGVSCHYKISVQMARLDDVISWQGLPGSVFVKLDIEGSELAFLRGATEMIRSHQPFILFEINPMSARAAGYSTEDVIEYLCELGYQKFSTVDRFPETASATDLQCDAQHNVLAIPARAAPLAG